MAETNTKGASMKTALEIAVEYLETDGALAPDHPDVADLGAIIIEVRRDMRERIATWIHSNRGAFEDLREIGGWVRSLPLNAPFKSAEEMRADDESEPA